MGLAQSIFLPVLPIFANGIGLSLAETGIAISLTPFIAMLLAPVWGKYSDQIGTRTVLLILFSLSGFATCLAYTAVTPTAFFISRAILGLGMASIAVLNATLMQNTPDDQRIRVLGLGAATSTVGFTFGPAIGGWWATEYDQLGSIFLVSTSLFMIGLLALPFLSSRKATDTEPQTEERESTGTTIKKPATLLNMCTIAIAASVITASTAFLPVWASSSLVLTYQEIGILLSLIALTVVIGQTLSAKIKQLGVTTSLAALGLAACMGLVTTLNSTAVILAFFLAGALCLGLIQPRLTALMSELMLKSESGKAMGIDASCKAAGRFIGPILISLVVTVYGVENFTGGLFAFTCLLLVLIAIFEYGISEKEYER